MYLTENSPQATQPGAIHIPLKAHQLASLYKMVEMDRNCGISNLGILADRAGYGKTITFLALVQELKGVDCKWMPQMRINIFKNYGIYSINANQQECIRTTLIVIPDKLVDHWYNHLCNYTELTFEVVCKNELDKICVEEYDVIVCPASLYNKFVLTHNFYWNRVAFDECDSIQIPNMCYIKSRFLWLISATFENLSRRKNRGFLTDFFKYCYRERIERRFTEVIIRGDHEFVKKSFGLIEPQITFIECLTPVVISTIRTYIDEHVLTLLNAGDIDNAIIRLGGSVTTDRNIIDLVVRNINNDIIKLKMKISTIQQMELLPEHKEERLNRVEEQLKSLENRREMFKVSFEEALKTSCSICLDSLSYATLVPCCNNIFCAKCIIQWLHLHKECPLCRAIVDPTKLTTLTEGEPSEKQEITSEPQHLTKFETIVKLVRENPDGKFLIFSGHATFFKELQIFLKNAQIQFGILTTANNTINTLNKFRGGLINVILLDAVNNGAGLEIPEATHVVLIHEMDPSLELQTIARAQRPGRSGQLQVIKLKYEHEYSRRNFI